MTTQAQPQAPVADAAPATEKSEKKGSRAYIVLGAIVTLALGGYLTFRAVTAGKESTDDAQVSTDMVPLASRVSGNVVAVLVKDNQPVKKGDPIASIDPIDYENREKQASAELDAAKAQADSADAQVKIVASSSKGGLTSARAALTGSAAGALGAEAQIAAAQAALARAQSDSQKADIDLRRAQQLRKDDAIPQAQVDTYQATASAARSAVAQAQAQLASAQEAKSGAQSRIAEAQGRVEQSTPVEAQLEVAKANAALAHARASSAEAALDLAKQQLAYTHIVAPFDGHVSKLDVHVGQLVSPGQVLTSVLPSATYVLANFKETVLALRVPRPVRRRQDRAGAHARRVPLRRRGRDGPDRHVGVHGEARRVAAGRLASGLRRLRRGRPAHRGRAPQAVLGAPARRDREGAPGRLQHPPADPGGRAAHRLAGPHARLPARS